MFTPSPPLPDNVVPIKPVVRLTDKELEDLRMQAEFQALGNPTPSWRNLVRALVELQERRWESRRGE